MPVRSGKWAFAYRKGVMSEVGMVLLAQSNCGNQPEWLRVCASKAKSGTLLSANR
ncbi:hypothetical protein [Pantoea sp. A4]|uniref:hypothetical protein n=1 Tax=Pantoea sp. A4 TaxID=1225184 RepID=UPI003FCCD78E